MRMRQALTLALTTGLAFGCASASAQDDQGKPVAPPPDKAAADAALADAKERARAAEDRIRDAEKRSADAKLRLGQLEKDGMGPDHPSVVAARDDLKKALADLERARAEAAAADPMAAERNEQARSVHEHVRAAEARAADAKARVAQLVEVEKKSPDDPAVAEARKDLDKALFELQVARVTSDVLAVSGGGGPFRARRAQDPHGRGPDGDPFAGGPPGRMDEHRGPGGPHGPMGRMNDWDAGPGPSVEQRLEMLERAVHEMHEMFERHHVDQQMRDRAEMEMRARALGGPDTRPMQPPPPMGPGAGPPPAPPRPPMARPDSQGAPGRPDDDRAADMRAAMQAQADHMRKEMETAHRRIEELSRQLADTQAQLKKAQDELEALRAKK